MADYNIPYPPRADGYSAAEVTEKVKHLRARGDTAHADELEAWHARTLQEIDERRALGILTEAEADKVCALIGQEVLDLTNVLLRHAQHLNTQVYMSKKLRVSLNRLKFALKHYQHLL